MEKVKIKVTGYDPVTHSLHVSYASDETKSIDPASYPSVAIQVNNMWPDVSDIEQLKKNIALAGVPVINQQLAKEALTSDTQKQNILKSLVGQTFEYDVSDFGSPVNPQLMAETANTHPVSEV